MPVLVALGLLASCSGEFEAGSKRDWYASDDATGTSLPSVEAPGGVAQPPAAFVPDLSHLSPADRGTVGRYLSTVDAHSGREGSWIFASPLSVDEAIERLLGPDPEIITEEQLQETADASAYTFVQVGDGVVAHEPTGFSDPSGRLLARLSRGGVTSAVTTGNIESMTRFGYARDGRVVFDDDEYAFVPDLRRIPREVRDLAALAWVDLEAEAPEGLTDWVAVGLAMCDKVTGVRLPEPGAEADSELYAVPTPWKFGASAG